MQPPASRSWHRECIHGRDSETGVPTVQVTSAPLIHENIYPEAPVFTPDSRHFIYSRRQALDLPRQYWLCDTATFYVRQLTDEDNVKGPAVSPDGRWMYYVHETDRLALKRVCLESFERETVLETNLIHRSYSLGTIRWDGQAYVTSGKVGPHRWGILKCDLQTRAAAIILEGDQICNAHPQYARGPSNDLLIQENHGCQIEEDGRIIALTSGYGADLHVIDDEGGNLRDVALGRTDLEMIQGHQCWLGRTQRVVSTLRRRDAPDQAFRSDRLVAITPGEDDREVIGLGRSFSHPNVSLDGRWWVCDETGTSHIYLGSVETHRHALFVRSRSSFGNAQYMHPHPAFSPDATKVVYNSDVTGVPQVYLARVEEGFVRGLAQ